MNRFKPSALSPQPFQMPSLFRAAKFVLLAAVLSLAFSACASSGNPTGTGPLADADKVLLERGQQALAQKKWASARQYFTKLLDGYPQSELRAAAKLGVGDSYLGEDNTASYVFALNEYREFLAFYPTNPRADYAQLQLGTAHYKQMLGPGRDQTETREAIREFQTFVDKYPTSSLIAEGQKKLREVKDRFSDSEYGVGMTYLRMRWYPGAIARFRSLLETDPGYTHKDALYFNLADAIEKSGTKAENKAEALPYYERLVAEFQESQYLEEAKRRIALLKTPVAGGL